MSCKGLSTGETYRSWWAFGLEYVCFNYSDRDTVRELKLALAEATGVVTRHESTVWTRDDENALALAAAEMGEEDLGEFNEIGWYIPGRETARLLLERLGYPDKQRLFVEYPLLTRAVDKWFTLDEEGAAAMDSVDPSVGAAGTPAPQPSPPGLPEPEPEGPPPWQPTEPYEPAFEQQEARMVPISPMMLGGAAVALLGLGFAVVYAARS